MLLKGNSTLAILESNLSVGSVHGLQLSHEIPMDRCWYDVPKKREGSCRFSCIFPCMRGKVNLYIKKFWIVFDHQTLVKFLLNILPATMS